MFKRLSKSRRHSADDVALSLSDPAILDGSMATSMPLDESGQDLNASALLRITRSKYTRRSCGDTTAMQTLLESRQDDEQDVIEADYQMVTAVPAYIVEHDPGKQRERPDGAGQDAVRSNGGNINNNDSTSNNNIDIYQLSKVHLDEKPSRKSVCQRSPSPFKSFFIRMGSTGMLNTANRINRRSQNIEEKLNVPDKESLFRSCSTSQLNSSPTYVKGDDPSEGIDLRMAARKDKTMSCDDLASGHRNGSELGPFEARDAGRNPTRAFAYPLGSPSVSVSTCDLGRVRDDEPSMRKSGSCDLKEMKKPGFPYAFLRSKLSVLPEERHGTLMPKDERLFKTVSEERFPTLQIDDSYVDTTTLGRKRSKTGSWISWNEGARNQESVSRSDRSSYIKFRRNSSGYETDRYSLNASRLERIEASLQRLEGNATGCYDLLDYNPPSLQENAEYRHIVDSVREKANFASSRIESVETPSENATELDMMTAIRSKRRNSASSSCEQRLSSHYVSSNESGYDSDGPRGESVAASENEGPKCNSDTSSVVDSEAEKPMRSSTPTEDVRGNARKSPAARPSAGDMNCDETNCSISPMSIERLDGLKWHQSGSGRMLPSMHGTSFDEVAVSQLEDSRLPSCEDILSLPMKTLDASPHRVRLQQDKSRFLSDIIQPLTRVRRCCLIQLHKRDSKESLGIRLAQQRLGEPRYVVVQLENDGIAHRDGRLRLGDEIVEVEGKEMRTLESLEEVQEFLKSFTGNTVRLMIAYDEAVPQVYGNAPSMLPGEYEYLENAKNLSNISLLDAEANYASAAERKTTNDVVESSQPRKRPDFLPLPYPSKSKENADSNPVAVTEPQSYLTRHVARFEKGYGKPSLGFSVVGGRDSPRGDMGIFVRRVFPGGQADISRSLFQGDEILNLNGKVLKGRTHQEVIELFKTVKEGTVELEVTRRHRYPRNTLKSAPY